MQKLTFNYLNNNLQWWQKNVLYYFDICSKYIVKPLFLTLPIYLYFDAYVRIFQINTHVTCLILQSIIASGAFHEGYNTEWPYNYFKTEWNPWFGPRYTVGEPQAHENSYASSSGSGSSEDLSNSASISKNANSKKKCKCSCKDCYKFIECCIHKCKRCLIKPTTRKTKASSLTKKSKTPAWPPYNTGPTYMIWPYVFPIMYSMKTSQKSSNATTTTRLTTTISKYTTTTTTLTTTTTSTSSTTTTSATTTTTPTTTTGPTTTTTSPTTTTTNPTTTTTYPSTTTTFPTTTTTTTTSRTTTSTEPPIPISSTTSFTYPVPDESSTSSTPTYPVLYAGEDTTELFLEEDDGTTISSRELHKNTMFEPMRWEYLYYDETTTTAKSRWRDHVYNYYEDYTTTIRTNKKCDSSKCRKRKKIHYYFLEQATTKPPFLMPTKKVSGRRKYSEVDNKVYSDETLKDYYNMVNDENMSYPRQYYFDEHYYYYTDKGNYNNIPADTVDM